MLCAVVQCVGVFCSAMYRAVMRYDEDLTRGDMEARWKEMNWLMEQKLSPFVILSWQTGMWAPG